MLTTEMLPAAILVAVAVVVIFISKGIDKLAKSFKQEDIIDEDKKYRNAKSRLDNLRKKGIINNKEYEEKLRRIRISNFSYQNSIKQFLLPISKIIKQDLMDLKNLYKTKVLSKNEYLKKANYITVEAIRDNMQDNGINLLLKNGNINLKLKDLIKKDGELKYGNFIGKFKKPEIINEGGYGYFISFYLENDIAKVVSLANGKLCYWNPLECQYIDEDVKLDLNNSITTPSKKEMKIIESYKYEKLIFELDKLNNKEKISVNKKIKKIPTDNTKKIIEKNKKDNWKGNGSGFFISESGYIVTNHHVIENVNMIEVEFLYKNELKSFNAKVINSDKTNDIAIIKIEDSNFSPITKVPYNFNTKNIDVGTKVFALGYPLALSLMGKDIKFTDGKISAKTGIDGNITTYQISASILPGSSGGPLFDYHGNLIGVNSSGLAREGYESVGYSIKSNYLLNLIDVLPETINLPSSTQLASKPLTEQIKVLSDYVVLIKVK